MRLPGRTQRGAALALALEVALGVAIAAAGVGTIIFVSRAQHAAAPPAARVTGVPIPTPSASGALTPASYVPWVALADDGRFDTPPPDPSPSPPVPIPPGTPACRADQLQGGGYAGGGLTGGVVITDVYLRNRGAVPCTLQGFPTIVIRDATARVLVKATPLAPGFLPATPAVAFLLPPGAPPLPRTGGPAMGWTTPGEARLDLVWIDCQQPRAATLDLTLPGGGGRLLIDFPMVASKSAGCYGEPQGSSTPQVGGGPFAPSGIQWPPDPKYLTVEPTLTLPPSVRRGSTLVYYVTLSNTSTVDYSLDQCPDYNEFVGPKFAVASFQLNCSPVRHIAAGMSTTFQMQLVIPASVPLGSTTLEWALIDGRLAQPFASVPITVTSAP